MTTIELAEEKWIRALRRSKRKWLEMVKKAETFEEYVRGVARFTKLPVEEVRRSAPAVGWSEFQKEAEKYVDAWISNIEAAYSARKWSKNYIEAFRTPPE